LIVIAFTRSVCAKGLQWLLFI